MPVTDLDASKSGASARALFLCDLVRSTDLFQQLGDQRTAELFRRHDRMARDLLTEHDGLEIDKSDGFLFLFQEIADAVAYALAYHSAVADLAAASDIPFAARAGIHFGDVFLYENDPEDVRRGAKPLEVEGLAKPLAARLMSLALPGQTLLTRAAFDLARDAEIAGADDRLTWLEHGRYRVQGLIEPLGVFEVGVASLAPLEAPPGSGKIRRLDAHSGPRRPALLVLPFEMIPAGDEHAFLSEGLTEEIITDLSKLESLRVLARSSAAQLKDSPDAIAELKQRFRLRYVLEGTVRKLGPQIRVNAKLLETDTHQLVWADKFSGTVDDFFSIQETIATAVVDALQVEVSSAEKKRIQQRPIPNMQAYEFYLRAKGEITRFRGDSLEKVVGYLEKGMTIMGEDNILLNSAMGYAYFQYFNAGITTDRAVLGKAKECAERILAQAPRSAHGHRLLGLLAGHEQDLARLTKHMRLALEDDANDTDALFWLALMYGYVGRPGAGFPLAEKLLEIDPLTPFYNCLPGWLSILQGDFDLAPDSLKTAYDMDRESPLLAMCYAHSLALVGRRKEAGEVFQGIIDGMPGNFHAQLAAFLKAALFGGPEAPSLLVPELCEAARKDFQYAWHIAAYLALLDQREEAIDWLTTVVDLGFIGYPLFSKQDPFLSNLRGEPAFEALMGRTRVLWQRFAV